MQNNGGEEGEGGEGDDSIDVNSPFKRPFAGANDVPKAKYMYNEHRALDGSDGGYEYVLWGEVGVKLNRRDENTQVLSLVFNNEFTAFHYDPFVEAPGFEPNSRYSENSAPRGLSVGLLRRASSMQFVVTVVGGFACLLLWSVSAMLI